MAYRWFKKVDVDEAIVVIMNSLDEQNELPQWLVRTIQAAIEDSDPAMVKYFYEELGEYAPKAMIVFEGRGGAD
ncbi:MAG TPA: hypothetical protein ENN85_09770 [Methanoculleus sp.]|nr:hypothetical protein [Methanoculleus sp.]